MTDAASVTGGSEGGVIGGSTEAVTQGVAGAVAEAEGAVEVVATFDFVTVQLYEGYSHAQYQSYVLGRPASQVVAGWVKVRGRGMTR